MIQKCLALSERQTGQKLRSFHFDEGGVYTISLFTAVIKAHITKQRLAYDYTSQKNGNAERMIHNLLKMTRTLLKQQSTSKAF